MTDYCPRDITSAVHRALKSMDVVVLTGLRQTGKTTFLRSEPNLGQRHYATFDDFAQIEAAKSDPDGFVRREYPLTIDEAHKCPEIFTAIKKVVDEKRTPGRFLLSGSANFSLLRNITESLAGRSIYLALCPFNRREAGRKIKTEPFLKRFFEEPGFQHNDSGAPIDPEEVAIGGMPTVCLRETGDPELWFRGYEQTYLERDVRELSRVQDLTALRILLRLTALRTGQLLSPSQLGRDAKLSAATTSRYLSLFEASFLIERLPPYLRNRASRLIKSPKLYMSDSGLAAYLAGLESSAAIRDDSLYGALYETYVAQNLRSILNSSWPDASLYFWTVQGRHEVDFVIETKQSCIAIELKSSPRWQKRDVAGLKTFLEATPHCKAGILCHNGEDAIQLGQKLWALPASMVLS